MPLAETGFAPVTRRSGASSRVRCTSRTHASLVSSKRPLPEAAATLEEASSDASPSSAFPQRAVARQPWSNNSLKHSSRRSAAASTWSASPRLLLNRPAGRRAPAEQNDEGAPGNQARMARSASYTT